MRAPVTAAEGSNDAAALVKFPVYCCYGAVSSSAAVVNGLTECNLVCCVRGPTFGTAARPHVRQAFCQAQADLEWCPSRASHIPGTQAGSCSPGRQCSWVSLQPMFTSLFSTASP